MKNPRNLVMYDIHIFKYDSQILCVPWMHAGAVPGLISRLIYHKYFAKDFFWEFTLLISIYSWIAIFKFDFCLLIWINLSILKNTKKKPVKLEEYWKHAWTQTDTIIFMKWLKKDICHGVFLYILWKCAIVIGLIKR